MKNKELRKTLSNFYPEKEVNDILRDINNLPSGEQNKEIELTLNFFKKYGEDIPSII